MPHEHTFAADAAAGADPATTDSTDSTTTATAAPAAEPAEKEEEEEEDPEAAWEPCYLFSYGSLQDRSTLRMVLQPQDPAALVLRPGATIRGYRLKLWGPYPAIVPAGPRDVVRGSAFWCRSLADFRRLQLYETDHYAWDPVEIEMADGARVIGRVFVWNAAVDELEEGQWSLSDFQRWSSRDMWF